MVDVSVIILILEEFWNNLSANGASIRIIEVLPNTLNTESMPTRKEARFNHYVHANRAVGLHIFFLLFVMLIEVFLDQFLL